MKITVKEILRSVVLLLDLADKVDLDDALDAEVRLLVKLVNLAVVDVTARIPLVTEERVTTDEAGKAAYADLSRPALRVCEVRHGGEPIRFRPKSCRIETDKPCAEVELTYVYRAPYCELDDELPSELTVADHAIAYGVCAEYASVLGMYDVASVWQRKFETEASRFPLPRAPKIVGREMR